jgi:hypothetical protein
VICDDSTFAEPYVPDMVLHPEYGRCKDKKGRSNFFKKLTIRNREKCNYFSYYNKRGDAIKSEQKVIMIQRQI